MNYPPRLKLAHLPTPIQKLERISTEVGKEIYIWRDDLTGFVESGNKIRKLEFLLADALEKGATRIVTTGGLQSNHTRATTFACRRLGLKVSLVVREPKTGQNRNDPPTANLLLNKIGGAELHFITFDEYVAAGSTYTKWLEKISTESIQHGEKLYVILEGGSVPIGCFGYIAAVEEMLTTWKSCGAGTKFPDALFFADGSGGTHAGLHLGYELHGLSTKKLWAINICDSAEYFQKRVGALIEETVAQFSLPSRERELQVLDGHFGSGYGLATDDDLKFYIELARKEGVLLDPSYTGKAFRGMLDEIKKDPARFGEKILFLHSGGTFGTFAHEERYAQLLGE
ncbi:MAG: D-cysteine desulfhydrase family protein [Verrucomicrobiota bacterium]